MISVRVFKYGLFPIFLALISITICHSQTQTRWVKEKIFVKAHKYEELGMDVRSYDWSDKKLNYYLGEVEKNRIQKKAFYISGAAALVLTANLYIYNEVEKDLITFSISQIVAAGGLTLLARVQQKRQDENTVKALERYNELGL